jgi:hypothetical protein
LAEIFLNKINMETKNEKQIDSCLRRNDISKNVTNDLHKQFVLLGRERNIITYKLLALLPEIYKQQIYKKYKCATIIEYAGKFAGLSKQVVLKALKLHENLKDKPFLQKAIETQGIHKVALIARIATPETDKAFADKVENMSATAIQTLSKELRRESNVNENNSGDFVVKKCQAAPIKMTIELDTEMQFLFLKLKNQMDKSLSNKEALRIILERLTDQKKIRQHFFEEKNDKKEKICSRKQKTSSRYIPIKIKNEAINKTDGKCSYPNCSKPAEVFHHPDRFSNSKSHESIISLCKIHHEFAHNGIIKNERTDPKKWQLQISNQQMLFTDKLFRKYRNKLTNFIALVS